jgi:hypothetical protein
VLARARGGHAKASQLKKSFTKKMENEKVNEKLQSLYHRRASIKRRMLVKMNWQEESILRHELIDLDFIISALRRLKTH